MRALLLEYGLTVPVGRKVFERSLPTILEDAENGLPDFIRALVLRLRERWQQLDIQIDDMSLMLGQASSASGLCQKRVPSPALDRFCLKFTLIADWQWLTIQKARDLSAWLGVGPRQYSTGGKSSLGGISKRGNSYLRQMVIQGIKAVSHENSHEA